MITSQTNINILQCPIIVNFVFIIMIAVIQRVKKASVVVNKNVVGQISNGLLVFLGIQKDDGDKEVEFLVNKVVGLRIFYNNKGKFDKSLIDIQGELLVVSQFTLLGNCQKGRRPSFDMAASPDVAVELYEKFVQRAKLSKVKVETGLFQEHMSVNIENDGPVTLILESP